MSYREHAADAIRAAQQGDPEAVFTWVRLPGGKIRLYASRRLADTAWGQREHLAKGVLWHLDVNLDQLLIVDRQTPAEALTWVLERWAREDAEAEREALENARAMPGAPTAALSPQSRAALPPSTAGARSPADEDHQPA
jgi:hypothetical protein